ncbi:MAG: Fic family protein [Burkholderiaceae bacterium]|nr:Fic family protein [Burkholderiaceae bacterium]
MPITYHHGAFPPSALDWKALIPLLGPTSAAIARYDGALAVIPNPDLLLSPLTSREAVLSSSIEGTHATMGEVLSLEAGAEELLPAERRGDIFEVFNYRAAMREAQSLLDELPLSQRVMCAAHRVLMAGVRGGDKAPGEYRRIPVWIGPDRHDASTARYVPVGAGDLPAAMGEWEKYLHADEADLLVQLAVAHAEFESLHPFLDGNGRVGRMLIPLYLWQQGLIRAPLFYMSGYFEANRGAYYDGLLSVSRDRDWTAWCKYFLEALRAQAEANHAVVMAIVDLYAKLKRDTVEWSHSQYAVQALDWMFGRPIFKSTDFVANAGIPPPTAKRLLAVFRERGLFSVLIEGRGRRSSVFALKALLNVAEGEEVFK